MDLENGHIGRRVREIRLWRGISLTATAQLAGISKGYLSLIERGERPVTKRAVLEGIASALRVAPVELTGLPATPSDQQSNATDAAMTALADILVSWQLGEHPDRPQRPWAAVKADMVHLGTVLRPAAAYAAQGEVLPGLILDLLAAAEQPHLRAEALPELLLAYHAVGGMAGHLGYRGLPALAATRIQDVAEALDDPLWLAAARWSRAHFLSGANRGRQYELAVAAAESPGARVEVRGMSHLTAALASAALGRLDDADTHLTEAAELAELIEPDMSGWPRGTMNFGRTNVGFWRTAIASDQGQIGRVETIAKSLRPDTITVSRQSAYWIDYGRALIADPHRRERGLRALLRAEQLAPQQARANHWMREAVSGLLRSAQRDAGGRDLRGLAYRIGIAPTG